MKQQTTFPRADGPSHSKDLCLLSLDGGGVRGLSILQILKRLMDGIDPINPPKPCDYFDMIGGTSTGGLIALMLGRMKMSVDECIEAYSALAPTIFTHIRHRIKLSTGETQGRFDHEAMENGIKAVLAQQGMDTECLLKTQSAGDCKTFVCATSQETAETVILSSYYNERRGSDLLNAATVWEAARATSAATTFFEPITIGDETFVDGATGANNPIQHLWSEAADVWGLQDNQLEENIKCLVSIGTGIPSLNAFGPGLKGVAKALKAIATETETTASLFRKHHTQLFQSGKAFRFNVVRGLEMIGLEETSKWGAIKAATRNYVQTEEVRVEMKACAANLLERECLESKIESILTRIKPHLSALNDEKRHLSPDDLQWLTHTVPYSSWCGGRSGILWYQSKRQLSYTSRKYVAASLAYHTTSTDQSNNRSDYGKRQDIACALYFQCDGSENIENYSAPEKCCVQPKTILWALIYQVLWAECEGVAAFKQRLARFDGDEEALRLEKRKGHRDQELSVLFDLLIMVLKSSRIRGVLAIDNVHLIDQVQCDLFFKLIVSLAESCYFGMNCTIRVMITGVQLETITGLNQTLHVNDDTEREGKDRPFLLTFYIRLVTYGGVNFYVECLRSLYFPEWNLRRDQVTDAETATNNWVWNHPQYKLWEESDSALLWVEGKPGSGKSVLAKTLQKNLAGPSVRQSKSTETGANTSTSTFIRTQIPRAKPHVVADWFYHSRGGDVGMAHESLLRSILYQLLQQDEKVFDAIVPIYRRHKPGEPLIGRFGHGSFDLLQKISGTGLSIVCIVDAMDEAKGLDQLDSRDVRRARTILSQLGNLLSKVRDSRMKFIVLSRPDPAIEIDYSDIKRRCYNIFKVVLEHENEGDIHYVIEKGIGSLQNAIHAYDSEENDDLPPTNTRKYKGLRTIRSDQSASGEEASLDRIRSYLKTNARGVILWVTLTLGKLEDHAAGGMCTFAELEQLMRTLPVGLDRLYDYIIKELESRFSNKELERTRKIFILVSGSASLNRPIRLRELWDALAVPIDSKSALGSTEDPIVQNRVPITSWVGLRRQLRRKCGPLIEIVTGDADQVEDTDRTDSNIGPDGIVQFMHRSVKDFLHSPQKCGPLHFSEAAAIGEVRAIAQRYIEVAFPAEQTLYAPPVPAMENSLWQDNIKKWVDYLERRILLCFCLSILSQNTNGSPICLGDYTSFDNLLYVNCVKEEDPIMEGERKRQISGNEILFFPQCLDWLKHDWSEAAGAFALGHALYSACTRGFVIATRNMLELCKEFTQRKNAIWDHVISDVALLACIEHGFLADVQTMNDGFLADVQTINDNRDIFNLRTIFTGFKSRVPSGFFIESQAIPGCWIDTFVEFAVRRGQEQIVEYFWENSIGYESGKLLICHGYKGKLLAWHTWDGLFYPSPSSLTPERPSDHTLTDGGRLDITKVGYESPVNEPEMLSSPNCTGVSNTEPDFPSEFPRWDESIALAGIGEWIEHAEDDIGLRDEEGHEPDFELDDGSVHPDAFGVDREINSHIILKEHFLRNARENLQRRLVENTDEILLDDIRDAVDLVMEW